MFDFVISTF